jgi:hypothetical protein
MITQNKEMEICLVLGWARLLIVIVDFIKMVNLNFIAATLDIK